jgi:rhodanese-related sulfurtransferase
LIPQITVHELRERLAAGEPVFLLDVREPEEHSYAAMPGSKLIPLGDLPGRVQEIDPPAGTLTVVYCHHGIRSLTGAHLLQRAGLESVASLAGGIDAWSRLIDPAVPRY